METLTKLAVVLVAVLTAFCLPSASATEYTDYQSIEIDLNAGSPIYEGTFTLDGYNPTYESLLWADVQFVIYNNSVRDTVSIRVGGENTTGGSTRSGFNLFNGTLEGEALLHLSDYGTVSFIVEWKSGDSFRLSDVALTAESTRTSGGSAVPEGGTTLGFLGLGLIGLELSRRKIRGALVEA